MNKLEGLWFSHLQANATNEPLCIRLHLSIIVHADTNSMKHVRCLNTLSGGAVNRIMTQLLGNQYKSKFIPLSFNHFSWASKSGLAFSSTLQNRLE